MKKLVLLIAIVILFSTCNSDSKKKETVLFLHYFTGNLEQGINELSESVNEKLRNVNLVATPLEHEEFKVNIRIQLETQNPPDIFSYWAGARTKYLVDQEKVSPINDLFKEDISITSFDSLLSMPVLIMAIYIYCPLQDIL